MLSCDAVICVDKYLEKVDDRVVVENRSDVGIDLQSAARDREKN